MYHRFLEKKGSVPAPSSAVWWEEVEAGHAGGMRRLVTGGRGGSWWGMRAEGASSEGAGGGREN